MRVRVISYDSVISITEIMLVKYMAEILPVRSARTVKSPPSLDSFGSSPGRIDRHNILNQPNGNASKMV